MRMAMITMLVSVSFTACSSDDDEGQGGNSIVGTWVHESNGYNEFDGPYTVTLTFRSNGTVSFVEKHHDNPSYDWTDEGTYRITETTLKIRWKEDEEDNTSWDDVWTVEYNILDNGATLWTSEDGGTVYKRK